MDPSHHQPPPIPASVASEPLSTIKELLQKQPEICFVRYQWVDYAGVLRTKVMVIEACLALLADESYVRLPPMALHCAVDSTLLTGTDYPGVHYLIPDWTSLSPTPYASTITVMCCISTRTDLSSPTLRSDLCPRHALSSVIAQAADLWDLEFLVGFEIEFQVMGRSDLPGEGMTTVSCGLGHFAASGMLDPCWPIVEECVQTLRGLGVRVHSLHTEGLCGQYEIALAPLPPLKAVDQLVLARSVLKQTFQNHGRIATMSPKPSAGAQPQLNGQHMHISARTSIPSQGDSFLAGMLKRLPQLWPFFLPHLVSYERVAPWMAGDHIGWGTENRTAAIRKVNSNHWELRAMDGTANVYLALAAALGAGLCGLAGNEPLTWPDATFAGATEPRESLPRSLEESLSALHDNPAGLDSILGDRLIQHYVTLKRYEMSRIERMGPEQARSLLIQIF